MGRGLELRILLFVVFYYIDPPDCGCGFMSVERVYALLSIPPLNLGFTSDFYDQQAIFPDIKFSCSGEVVKWIVAGKWSNNEMNYPQLQIWRLSEGSSTNYEKLYSTTVIDVDSEEDDNVYEYTVDYPLPFQPGDILGVLQPGHSKLQVRYEQGGGSVYYYSSAGDNNDVFDIISGESVSMETNLPLVTVEISKFLYYTTHYIVLHTILYTSQYM